MLVQQILGLTKTLSISLITAHIAIHYMDYVLSKIDFQLQMQSNIALTCLIIAAKYDELDCNIPSCEKFIKASKFNVSKENIHKCELQLLTILDWNLRVVTP